MSTQAIAPFLPALRIHQSLTAAAEKRLLHWIAARLPRWVTSDGLTILGFGAQLAAGAGYALSRYNHLWLFAVIAAIILNWFGDSLDGTVARIRNQQRPRYGFYVDHVVDIFGSTALLAGLAMSGLVQLPVALAMLICFLLLAGESYLATYTLGRFEMSQGLFGPTELRLLLIIANIAALRNPFAHILGHSFLLFDIGGIIGCVCMAVMVLTLAAKHTVELFRQERIG